MSGLGRVVVGYRNTRELQRMLRETGQQAFPTRPCVAGCGQTVYFVRSGFDAARYRDAEPICKGCYEESKDSVQVAL